MEDKTRAVVLFSGGQDSTTCLYWAKQTFDEVVALNVFYGQRHQREIQSAKWIAEKIGVPLVEFELDVLKQIGDSALFNEDDISSTHRGSEELPASFVPGRNLFFLTVAAAYAFKNDFSHIITGVCQTDYSGYPDCRIETIKSLEHSLNLGMSSDFQIHTPLMYLSKKQTVELAQKLEGCMEGLKYSHTCYNGEFPPCGKCPACILRQKGFDEAGVVDPIFTRSLSDG